MLELAVEFLRAYKAGSSLKQEQGEAVYNGSDVFVVLLTGFGKITCFQVPLRVRLLALAIVSAEKIVLAS